jgi:hypothetical protein
MHTAGCIGQVHCDQSVPDNLGASPIHFVKRELFVGLGQFGPVVCLVGAF